MQYFYHLWDLFVDMSFYIVIGLIFTGLLHAFVNKDVILKHIGKKSASSVVKASVFGVPLPLCSCGVVPTAMYLGKNGASKGAVVSFLTSTPQTGIDSIIATYGLMGPLFAVYRAVAAFVSGIISGIVTNLFCKEEGMDYSHAPTGCGCSHETQDESSECCSHEKVEEVSNCGCCSHEKIEEVSSCSCSHEEKEEVGSSCGCSKHEDSAEHQSFFSKLSGAFTYAFGEFLDEIAGHFVIGLLIAALISTVIPEQWLSNFTNPIVSMLIMLIIGIPMYICSTASIPIALSLMIKGITPGAAFVFLFAGPVTNIASLIILKKALGNKVLAIYLASAAMCAIAFGLILDYIIERTNYQGFVNLVADAHIHGMPIHEVVIAVIFGLLVGRSLLKKYFRKTAHKSCCS